MIHTFMSRCQGKKYQALSYFRSELAIHTRYELVFVELQVVGRHVRWAQPVLLVMKNCFILNQWSVLLTVKVNL